MQRLTSARRAHTRLLVNGLRLLAAGLALAAATPVWAKEPQPCDSSALAAIGKYLGRHDLQPSDTAQGARQGTALIAAACKRWPDDARFTVAAVAYRPHGAPAPDNAKAQEADDQDALLVAMVDTSTGKLVHSYETTVEEDAMTELGADSLWVDTARYRLAPDVRAFGVVMRSDARGPSCPDAGFSDELTLFVPDGEKLRPVFDTYLSLWQAILPSEQCPPQNSESATLTIGVGKGTSHGYADLVVTAQTQVDRSGADGSDHKMESGVVRKTVQYDGRTYPFDQVPKFWQRYPW